MSIQREFEVQILFKLWIFAHEGSSPVTEDQLRKIMQKKWKISNYRFEDAFCNLRSWKYLTEVDLNKNADVTYRLSPRGIDWVEGWFRIGEEDETFSFYPRHKGTVMVDMLRTEYERKNLTKGPASKAETSDSSFWQKWGALAGIAALFIPFIIWWLA